MGDRYDRVWCLFAEAVLLSSGVWESYLLLSNGKTDPADLLKTDRESQMFFDQRDQSGELVGAGILRAVFF